jgi:hypothetical protein
MKGIQAKVGRGGDRTTHKWMIFAPLFAFFGKTRSADSGHGSLSRKALLAALWRGVFSAEEVEGVVEDQERYGGRRGRSVC